MVYSVPNWSDFWASFLSHTVSSGKSKFLQDLVFLIRDAQFLDPFGWESGKAQLQVRNITAVTYASIDRRWAYCPADGATHRIRHAAYAEQY